MTLQEIYQRLSALGYPVAYMAFSQGQVPDTPFIVYHMPGTDNFSADGDMYYPVSDLYIELYTEKKDLEAEKKIEGFLKSNNLFYERQEYYIESEKYIQNIYMISIGGI